MTLYLLFTCSLFCPFNATNAPGIFSYKVDKKILISMQLNIETQHRTKLKLFWPGKNDHPS